MKGKESHWLKYMKEVRNLSLRKSHRIFMAVGRGQCKDSVFTAVKRDGKF